MTARNPSSSDTAGAARTGGRRRFSLRPLRERGGSVRTPKPPNTRPGRESSEETATVPVEQAAETAPRLPAWLRRLGYYGLALLFVAAAAIVRREMADILRPTPFLVFYLAWVSAAAFGGFGPGLLATLASWFCVDLLFDTTPGHVGFTDPLSMGRFVVLLAGGLTVSIVGEKMRRARIAEGRQRGQLAQLARSLDRERQTLQSVMDGAWNSHLVFLDRDFNFVRVNEAYARTCGYTPEEMIGKNHFALYPHAENEAIFARVRDTGEPFEVHDKPFVFPNQPERGTTYWDWTLIPIKNEVGYVEGLVFSLFETTGRKRAEEALRESEERLHLALGAARMGAWQWEVGTEHMVWSPELYALLGYEPGRVTPTHQALRQRIHPEDLARWEQALQESMERCEDYACEFRVVWPDGSVHWVEARGQYAYARDESATETVWMRGVLSDIESRKQVEETLRENEEKYRRIVETATEGIAMADAEARLIFVNDRWSEIFGYRPEEATHITLFDVVFPEDVARMKERWESRKHGQEERYEWRYRRKDGRPVWVLASVAARFGPSGEFLGTLVLNTDITERKQAEEALRESEARLRVALDGGHMGTWVWDLATDTVDTDPLYRRLWDLDDTDVRVPARVILEKIHPADRTRTFDRQSAQQRVTGPIDVEFRIQRRDGSITWLQGSAVPIRDAGGTLRKVIGVNFDITERKRVEESLRELTATLESKVVQRTEELERRAWQLQKLTLELSEAEERERERVAQILHDDLQQVLAAAKFHLSRVGSGTGSPEQSQQIVEQVKQMLKDAIEKSRHLSHELSPAVLRQGDLAEAFDWLAEQMQAKHGLTVHVEAIGAVQTHSDAVKALLYRSAQEMLFNVVKHAQVSEARLRVRRRGRYIFLSVSDRGRGFDPGEIEKTTGFGLLNIRERVALLGGRMKIRSARGRGTTFRLVVPDAASSADDGPGEKEPNGRALPDHSR